MISFVWSSRFPFYAGAGGSENYTAGQIRELNRRNIACRVLTLGHGEEDGREGFPDIDFQALKNSRQLSRLNDTIVFITYPLTIPTRRQSYAILHCPPPDFAHDDPLYNLAAFPGKQLLATSRFGSRLWRDYLGKSEPLLPVVYPFAEAAFGAVKRRPHQANQSIKVLFAGRLTHDKGIYTLLAALHMEQLHGLNYELTVTTAGSHSEEGQIILKLLKAHPSIKVVHAKKTPQTMARLLAEHDVVVMPSTRIFWQETFGILSVEAQHAGCRVVASRSGGLPETNCGGLLPVEPDNPKTLAQGLAQAIKLGPLSDAERQIARTQFTVSESVDSLLAVLASGPNPLAKKLPLHTAAALRSQLSFGLETAAD